MDRTNLQSKTCQDQLMARKRIAPLSICTYVQVMVPFSAEELKRVVSCTVSKVLRLEGLRTFQVSTASTNSEVELM